jgi:autotransporter-associated beta strand protein
VSGPGGFTPVLTLPGPLIVGGPVWDNSLSPACNVYAPHQIGDNAPVTVGPRGLLTLQSVDETIGALSLSGATVDTHSGTLTLNGNVQVLDPGESENSSITGELNLGSLSRIFTCATNGNLDLVATVRGGFFGNLGAGITKGGPGAMTLTASNAYPGSTFVTGGDLYMDHLFALGTTNGYVSVGTNAALWLFPSDDHTNNPTVTGRRLVLYGGSKVYLVHSCAWDGPVELPGGSTRLSLLENGAEPVTVFIYGVISGAGGFDKVGSGDLWLVGPDHNTYTGRTYVEDGTLGLLQGGFGPNRVAVPGPLVIGAPNTHSPSRQATVEAYKSDTITGPSVVVNADGALLFKASSSQTFSNLAVNSGLVDSAAGTLYLNGSFASTNYFLPGKVTGRLALGNVPHTFHVQSYRVSMQANVSGGPNATLNVTGGNSTFLDLESSNSFGGLIVIRSGGLNADRPSALGATNAGVIVTNTGSLWLRGHADETNYVKAFLHLSASMADISYNPLFTVDQVVWNGPVWLGLDTAVFVWDWFTCKGPIAGPGGLEVKGGGELILAGAGPSQANTYNGPTFVTGATLTLAKKNGALTSQAVPGDVTVRTDPDGIFGPMPGRLRLAANAQLPPSARVSLEVDCALDCASDATNTLASFTGAGDVVFRPRSLLKAGADNQNFNFTGRFFGGNPAAPTATCFEKHGLGALVLNGQNTVTGAVDVVQGNLWLPGSLPNATVNVRINGLFSGPGYVRTTRVDGGTFWPGGNQGTMTGVSCSGGIAGLHTVGTLKLNLYGPTAASGCDRLELTGLSDVENLRLALNCGAFVVPVGERFVILSNAGPNSVLGKFNDPATGADLAEGAKFFAGTQRFAITYAGGNGNDVVLTRVADPTPAQIGGITPDPNGVTLNAQGEPGVQYRVEANFDLGNPAGWTQIGAVTMNNSGLASFIDTDATIYPMRFYRFVAP